MNSPYTPVLLRLPVSNAIQKQPRGRHVPLETGRRMRALIRMRQSGSGGVLKALGPLGEITMRTVNGNLVAASIKLTRTYPHTS